MKRPGVSLALLPAMLFVLTGLHAGEPAAKPETKPATTVERAADSSAPMRGMAADDLLKRFDKNGDGKLDDDERVDAHEAMLRQQMIRKEAASATPASGAPEQFRQRMLEMFDRNHDGQLDATERAEARKYAETQGLEPGSAIRKELLQRFDANGDGKLDEAERAEMRKVMQDRAGKAGPGGAMRQELLRRYDKNGDGKIDDVEWAEAGPALRERVTNAPEQLRRYDKNADGRLDDAEWAAASQQIRRFLNETPAPTPAAAVAPKATATN